MTTPSAINGMPIPDLEQAFVQYEARLLRMVSQRLSADLAARVDPAEILQKAFLRAGPSWDRFHQSGMTFYSWIYRIVLDTLLDERDWHLAQRREVHREVRWPDDSSAQAALGLIGTTTSPSNAHERKELQERVRQILNKLQPEDREILCMRYFDELTTDEVAQVLHLNGNAVRQRYARARMRFKDAWKVTFGLEGGGA